ncbi:MAG TPA: hypothetical protein PLK30_14580 [Blastocatellia bacterium]|nr:hypothetical protein [Blastocatellia bacterium]
MMTGNNLNPPPENNEYRLAFFGFSELLEEYSNGVRDVLKSEGANEQIEVLEVMKLALKKQASSLVETFQDIYDSQDAEGRQFLEKFIRSTDVTELIVRSRALLKGPTLQKRSLLEWIILIIELIKEILVMIGDLFNLPDRVIKFILGILEIVEKILKFIAMLLGQRGAEIADSSDRIFWTSLERYWNTTAAWKKNPLRS